MYSLHITYQGSYNFDAHYSNRGPCLPNHARDGCTMLTSPPAKGAEIWYGGEGFAGDNHETYVKNTRCLPPVLPHF